MFATIEIAPITPALNPVTGLPRPGALALTVKLANDPSAAPLTSIWVYDQGVAKLVDKFGTLHASTTALWLDHSVEKLLQDDASQA